MLVEQSGRRLNADQDEKGTTAMERTVVVTGAASGIGRGVSEVLIERGYRVAALDLREDALEAAWSGRDEVIRVAVDVADRASLQQAVDGLRRVAPPLTGVVTCAGIYRPAEILDVTDDDFEALMRVNVRGTFLPSQIVARALVEQGTGGSIVTVTSVAASEPTAVNGAYATTKGAVTSLTRALAVSLAPHDIRANAIQPGPVATPMGASATVDPVYEARMLARVLRRRYAQPADVANVAAFLIDDASEYLTGIVVPVDGGVLAHR